MALPAALTQPGARHLTENITVCRYIPVLVEDLFPLGLSRGLSIQCFLKWLLTIGFKAQYHYHGSSLTNFTYWTERDRTSMWTKRCKILTHVMCLKKSAGSSHKTSAKIWHFWDPLLFYSRNLSVLLSTFKPTPPCPSVWTSYLNGPCAKTTNIAYLKH